MIWIFALVPFLLQAAAILFDEFYFHVRRGLPKWERIGHPLDTLSLLVCFLFALWVPFDSFNLKIYMGLAAFSCLMVTKDEFIHKTHCKGTENWLHACLFVLHPITLAITCLIWPLSQGVETFAWFSLWMDHQALLKDFLLLQAVMIASFFFYQLIFWNIVWKNSPVQKF